MCAAVDEKIQGAAGRQAHHRGVRDRGAERVVQVRHDRPVRAGRSGGEEPGREGAVGRAARFGHVEGRPTGGVAGRLGAPADAAGTVPETLDRLSPELEADARRSLAALVIAAGWLIWALVAAFIVFLIFSLAMFYVGMLDSALEGI